MKAPRRAHTTGLFALTVGGTMLAALAAAPAANADISGATARARAPFTTQLQVSHSLKCLEVANAGNDDGEFVQQSDCDSAAGNQIWEFVGAGDGFYTARVSHSDKCLDVADSDQSDGAKVQQFPCHGLPNQQWKLVQRPNGFFSIVARHSGKCLGITEGGISNGGDAVQQTCDSELPYQDWRLL